MATGSRNRKTPKMRNAALPPVLEDLLRPGLRLVFCGTAASRRSAEVGAYYAGPGNKFWRTIHAVGLTPRLLMPAEWRALDALGIGFTDMAKAHFGMDRELPAGAFDASRVKAAIEEHQPEILAFNGKTAARAYLGSQSIDYGLHGTTIGRTAIWVLPSTSGAASGAWRIGPWQELADAMSRRMLSAQ
jgi:double-stranded uracil-DNA glycosylase